MPSACWTARRSRVAAADEFDRVAGALERQAETLEHAAPEGECRLEGLADFVIDATSEQAQRVATVERAHEQRRRREFGANQIDDAVGGRLRVDAHRNQARLVGAGGAQDVEPRAVAVINLEAEPAGILDHLGIGIDGDDVDALGEQALGDDLAEAAETDQQDRAAGAVEIVGERAGGVRRTGAERAGSRREGRAHHHGGGGDRRVEAGLGGGENAARHPERDQHERELARRGEDGAGLEGVALAVAHGQEQDPDHQPS